ncbi:MAG: hypothetical protein ABI789_05985 [Usitatibacter sp.]
MTVSARNASIACALAALALFPARAEESAFKLTVGEYRYSDHTDGIDANLRYGSVLGNAWLGYYRGIDEGISQWRAGWDRSFGTGVRVSPSIQLASGGFVGGSVQAEIGAPYFAGVGLGRTNLRPYVNLNFDPNDSYVVQAGRRDESGRVLMVQMVRDNRQNPDQRHFHFLYREPIAGGERLTLDALYKVGNVEGERIRRWGGTATYDWPRFFVRVARDPKTNFTPVDAWRVSVGTRF